MFAITQGKGFHMTFENGLTISVQFGRGNYCERYWKDDEREKWSMHKSKDAEIAVWDTNGSDYMGFMKLEEFGIDNGCESVKGYVTADEVADVIYKVKNWKKE